MAILWLSYETFMKNTTFSNVKFEGYRLGSFFSQRICTKIVLYNQLKPKCDSFIFFQMTNFMAIFGILAKTTITATSLIKMFHRFGNILKKCFKVFWPIFINTMTIYGQYLVLGYLGLFFFVFGLSRRLYKGLKAAPHLSPRSDRTLAIWLRKLPLI